MTVSGRSRVCVCPAGLGPARAPSVPVSVPVPHGREQALARWAPSAVRSRGTAETRTKRGTGSPATGPGLVSPRRSRGSPRRMCFGNTATQWRGYSGSPRSTSTPVPRPGSSVCFNKSFSTSAPSATVRPLLRLLFSPRRQGFDRSPESLPIGGFSANPPQVTP